MHKVNTLFRYLGVSALLLPFNLGTAWFIQSLGGDYLLATAAGIVIQVTGTFFLNRKFTFNRSDIGVKTGLSKVYLIESVSLTIALSVVALLVEVFSWDFIHARLCAVLVICTYDYLVSSIFIFKTNPFK